MLFVGLTGGIGVGKTTIARLFRELGVIVMEADQMVHELLSPGTPVWQHIVSIYGTSILASGNDKIDRVRLAGLAFKERKALNRLLDILYPPLKKALIKKKTMALREGAHFFLFDASQILEAGWEAMFDIIILVRTEVDVCRERHPKRDGLALNQICLRMGFQWPDWVKMRYADFLIDNSGPLWKTEEAVDFIYRRLVEISKAKKYQSVG